MHYELGRLPAFTNRNNFFNFLIINLACMPILLLLINGICIYIVETGPYQVYICHFILTFYRLIVDLTCSIKVSLSGQYCSTNATIILVPY